MMYTSVVSSYVICSDNIMERTINEFSSSGVSPYVSYRQGGQSCLSLCKKPRRQPYVTYVAYVLMYPALSGTRGTALEPHKQESNSKKRYGVALMFLRAHGRNSMPVSLEALMFLCPYVLMFSR